MDFHAIKVNNIVPETPDTVTLEFAIPDHLLPVFAYKQGQHITIRHELNGHEVRRSYSMSSSPVESRFAVTVKKVAGGRMSTFLHDQLKAGDTLELAPPDGRFFTPLDPDKRRTYYIFGAGSGITPLLSILKTTLEVEPMSSIFLLYGSRDEENIIFRDELERLSERYTGQLFVEHILSRPKKAASGNFLGLFKKYTSNWAGKTGRIDGRAVGQYLDENLPHGPEGDCQYFICGPGNMAETVKAALLGRGTSSKLIHTEHFVNPTHIPGEFSAAPGERPVRLIVHLHKKRIETTIPPGATILDVMVKEKHDAPYSCTAGACSTCMAKVVQGKVRMDACYALDDEEVKAGYCLTCQSHPDSDVVEISYDL
ncbi:MAG: ferredoxin--NADP reductase [Saprospirales bacterium]|jgi:ring-1,2-phenylacetyl-CoA epoxidase subunit PaaE|nr:ferredoxin--NADP reductase [Saprospirales bacterium]